jgi:hypothetical protein
MSLPGLLVEYLVVGAMALLWLLPLSGIRLSESIPFESAAALAPAIYVVGMFVDFIAYILLSLLPTRKYSLKTFARWITHRKLDIENLKDNALNPLPGQNTRKRIWLQLKAPDIIKEIKERSSRDRIARGALVNILFTWAVSNKMPDQLLSNVSNFYWLIIAIIFFTLWIFFEGNSYSYEVRAGEMVPENEH